MNKWNKFFVVLCSFLVILLIAKIVLYPESVTTMTYIALGTNGVGAIANLFVHRL